MKLGITSRISAFFHDDNGLSYTRILRYFYPECITALIIYFLPYCIDCYFICNLKSTNLYAVSGIVDNFLTMFLKAAEGLSIGTVIVAGYHNGLKQYRKAGEAFVDAFWTVIGVGALVSITLFCTVAAICHFNNFSPDMIKQGIPYLQIKSASIFFMFIYFALVGFLRAIKNTFVPMVVFAFGSVVFVCVDYVLIFGAYGFPQMCLLGSAVASLSQYFFMSVAMFIYVAYSKSHEKYGLSFLTTHISFCRIRQLLLFSIPVLIDKVSIAFAYAWLGSCMSHLGPTAGAAFSSVKLMERFAFLPAIAFAQVITFLVSNDVGGGRWKDIHANIKKVVLMATIFVGAIAIFGSLWPYVFINLFDRNREFGHLVATLFPSLSILILIDLLQLILSAALRGAGDVKTVMKTRIAIIAGFFIPSTYIIAMIPIKTLVNKMMITYASFLIGNGLMSIVYIVRLRQKHWKKINQKACNE
ncbi:MAG TPA: MATE family efflux transporter [Candidatus Saccharimonadales bacterium]|nr:MATE family efflux transporter [Candidatus Saccharimonadales bacterium]